MLRVKMNSEIREYEGRTVGPFTTRQFISFTGLLMVSLGIFFLGRNRISPDLLPWMIIIFAVLPFGCYGWMKPNDMKFEQYLKTMFRYYFHTQKFAFKDTEKNIFLSIRELIVVNDVIEQKIDKGIYEENEAEWEVWQYEEK
jgi:hypothetical protein